MAAGDDTVEVFLLSGFLGSGKTSLIRRLLNEPALADTALIINEFGEIGLDQLFVRSAVENTLLLENGCVCCSIRGDLTDTIGELFVRAGNGEIPAFSRIIVETTGLADPAPVVAELRRLSGTPRPVRLAKVIVTVDGVLGPEHIRTCDEAVAQIAQADLCLITKADIVDANIVNALADSLRGMNPAARVAILDPGALDIASLLAPEPVPPAPPRAYRLRQGGAAARHRGVATWSREVEEPLGWAKLRDWLDLLYSLRAPNLIRMKALLNLEGAAGPVVIHGVGPLFGWPEPLDSWPTARPLSRLVVITRNMPVDVVGRSFEAIVTGHPAGVENGR
ncbi:GTP-binding protein [Starkeya koreensis]|uniref:GTP-binding protein n=1 Tax=Ancylobacter koreensis TaxID=266121 RepID=A0ABT0DR14_9HYPH|nr:GTP-binding protein [Ancylobacter koreensis]MCK0209722.1 GTP-binding protein [Ancylobacter koreensis]